MIRRRWFETIVLSLASLGLLAWSANLFHNNVFFGLVAGVFGLALGGMAVLGPASGPCPVCNKMLHGLFAIASSDYDRCPHCRAYFRRADRQEVPRDHVADMPTFSVPIGEGERLPNICCVCAAPAEKVKEVVESNEGRISHVNPTLIKTKITVPVPYCAQHDEGVSIWNEDLAPSVPMIEGGQQITDHRWVLKVRSYGFYRAAVRG